MKTQITVCTLIACVSALSDAADTTVENKIREAQDAVKVRIERRKVLSSGASVISADVTEKQNFLLWDGILFRLSSIWGTDASKEWLVNCDERAVIAYDIPAKLYFVKTTKLPIKSIQNVGGRDTRTVSVILIDGSTQSLDFKGAQSKDRIQK